MWIQLMRKHIGLARTFPKPLGVLLGKFQGPRCCLTTCSKDLNTTRTISEVPALRRHGAWLRDLNLLRNLQVRRGTTGSKQRAKKRHINFIKAQIQRNLTAPTIWLSILLESQSCTSHHLTSTQPTYHRSPVPCRFQIPAAAFHHCNLAAPNSSTPFNSTLESTWLLFWLCSWCRVYAQFIYFILHCKAVFSGSASGLFELSSPSADRTVKLVPDWTFVDGFTTSETLSVSSKPIPISIDPK